jgi:hypothetical protein
MKLFEAMSRSLGRGGSGGTVNPWMGNRSRGTKAYLLGGILDPLGDAASATLNAGKKAYGYIRKGAVIAALAPFLKAFDIANKIVPNSPMPMHDALNKIKNDVYNYLKGDHKVQSDYNADWSVYQGGVNPKGAPPPKGPIQAYAKLLLNQHGWGAQWAAFNALEMGEAGWDPYARNKDSGAYGLPQALPASKLDAYGNRNDFHVQLRWMMDYIGGRYKDPARAYGMWLSRHPHWYASGGIIPGLAGGGIVLPRPGGTIVRLGEGGKREAVVPLNGSDSVGSSEYHFHGDLSFPNVKDKTDAGEFLANLESLVRSR